MASQPNEGNDMADDEQITALLLEIRAMRDELRGSAERTRGMADEERRLLELARTIGRYPDGRPDDTDAGTDLPTN